jgi:ligand-binding sensor domain-containing protein
MTRLLVQWLGLLLFAAAIHDVAAQDGRWETHTSFRQTNDAVEVDGELWVATSGGVYRYDAATGERSRYTVVEGLHGVAARALDYDRERGLLWVGYADGVFDRVDLATGTVRSFFDIRRASQFASRTIMGMDVAGDSLFILTDFGIVVFDTRPNRLEVRDTYSQLGLDAAVGARVYDIGRVTFEGRISLAAATESGLGIAPIDAPNLQDPSAWLFLTDAASVPGELSGALLSVAEHGGDLYVGAENGLYRVRADRTFERLSQHARVQSLTSFNNRLLAVDDTAVLEVLPGGEIRRTTVHGFRSPSLLIGGEGDRVWLGDTENGVAGLQGAAINGVAIEADVSEVMPQGPYHGSFSMLHIDSGGTLWASGVEAPGTGVYRRRPDGEWTSFVGAYYPELAGRGDYLVVDTDPDGNLWAGSHGSAVIRINPEDEITVFDHTNSALTPIRGSQQFVVVRGIAADQAGNVWVSNVFGETQLVVRRADGEWVQIQPVCGNYTIAGNVLHRLFIDSVGNKWFIVVQETNLRVPKGVMVYESGPTLGEDDDECRFFSTEGGGGQGLPSVVVNAVAEDRDGRIWVGTNSGLAFTPTSRLLARSTGEVFIWPQPSDRSLGNFLLFGVRITALAVDASNRIWIGTFDQGVYAVQDSPEGGFDVVAHFTPENSPLLSESVVSIAADGRSGRVFFATDRGLVSYDAGAITPVQTAGDLRVSPNPVRIDGDVVPRIRIDGLVEATELRIVTASGELVRRMTTRGGQVEWDGRDLDGRIVRSGMYLIVAVGTGGEGRGVGKIAIIR